MHRTRSSPRRLASMFAAVGLIATACGTRRPPHRPRRAPAPATAAATARRPPIPTPRTVLITPAPIAAERPAPTAASSSAGSSASAPAPSPQQLAAGAGSSSTTFNAVAEGRLHLRSRSSTTTSPRSILKTEIAAGNAPDIIGPVGVEGLNLFRDQLLDLAPLIAKTELQRARRRPQARRLLQDRRERRHDRRSRSPSIPSFLYYNKDLFDEAKLPYPPTKVGDLYQGKPWDMDALAHPGP